MTSLIAIRDAIAASGVADLNQLSHHFKQPPALIKAMLKQLEAMGQIEQVGIDKNNLKGNCKNCPDGETCQTESYQIKKNASH